MARSFTTAPVDNRVKTIQNYVRGARDGQGNRVGDCAAGSGVLEFSRCVHNEHLEQSVACYLESQGVCAGLPHSHKVGINRYHWFRWVLFLACAQHTDKSQTYP
jgi:hypothetical protein